MTDRPQEPVRDGDHLSTLKNLSGETCGPWICGECVDGGRRYRCTCKCGATRTIKREMLGSYWSRDGTPQEVKYCSSCMPVSTISGPLAAVPGLEIEEMLKKARG